jgi:hypothetical protein
VDGAFRGIHAEDVSTPFDLIYLDAECRVIETVEFFPTLHASEKSESAASVLALPAHSIASSHTKPGDRILLNTAEEMRAQLEREDSEVGEVPSRPSSTKTNASRGSSRSSVANLPNPGRRQDAVGKRMKTEERASRDAGLATQTAELEPLPVDRPGRIVAPPKGWLERWLFPEPAEPRSSERKAAAGLTAHFWTGGMPQSHPVRDISSTGLYVETTERWYPGTLIRMTLSKLNPGHEPAECSIVLQCRSVRCGDDGVGVEFVFENPKRTRKDSQLLLEAVNAKHLEEFLKRFREGSREA